MYEVVALIVLVILGMCSYNVTYAVMSEVFGSESVVTKSASWIVWFFVFLVVLKIIAAWLEE